MSFQVLPFPHYACLLYSGAYTQKFAKEGGGRKKVVFIWRNLRNNCSSGVWKETEGVERKALTPAYVADCIIATLQHQAAEYNSLPMPLATKHHILLKITT